MGDEKRNWSAIERAKRIIQERGGLVRTAEAIRAGIHPRTLYALRDTGVLEQISRGVYRLAAQSPMSNPDLVTVAVRFPKSVVCLVSALAYHGITTQIPHSVSIAIDKGSESPRIEYPPVSVYRFSGESLSAGIEEHTIDGAAVRIYDPEKTLADCFKFRNRIGMEIVLEALRLYKTRKRFNIEKLMEYARICRVEKVMRPYLEATV
jgi:predicted transcriptional regulator of viral defense system